MKSKIYERERAIELRKQGLPTTKIAAELGVSKASAFNWTKNVPLTEEQQKKLFKNKNNHQAGLDAWVKKCYDKRIEHQMRGRQEINRHDWEHAAGCMLWWAEGDKSRNHAAITNTDSNLLVFFVKFLKKYYDIADEDVSIRVQYHGDLDEVELGEHWKSVLGLPNATVMKGYKKEKRSSDTKWAWGICRLQVNSTELTNRLWGSVQEYVGFTAVDALRGKSEKSTLQAVLPVV